MTLTTSQRIAMIRARHACYLARRRRAERYARHVSAWMSNATARVHDLEDVFRPTVRLRGVA